MTNAFCLEHCLEEPNFHSKLENISFISENASKCLYILTCNQKLLECSNARKFYPKFLDHTIVTNQRFTDFGRNITKLELYQSEKKPGRPEKVFIGGKRNLVRQRKIAAISFCQLQNGIDFHRRSTE